MTDSMQGYLQAYCRRSFPAKQQLQVERLVSVTAGWENEVYAFDIEYGPEPNSQLHRTHKQPRAGELTH